MEIGSELVSIPTRMAVRSDNGSLQNSVGAHFCLKSAQECRLMSSASTAELGKPICAFVVGMMVSCGFARIVVVDQIADLRLETVAN